MVPSCCLWKVVTFFGKEHVDWFSISGVTVGRSWTIKSIIFLVTPILNFPNLIFQLLPIITSLILNQWTWFLPKNVTTFHGQQDGIINFCLSPNKMGVLAIWMMLSNWVWKRPFFLVKILIQSAKTPLSWELR